MNRRQLLTSMTALTGTAMFSDVLAQSGSQITHVDTKTSGPFLQSSVVEAESLH